MRGGNEPVPEGMRRALEDLVALIADGPRERERFFFLDLWDEAGEADLHVDGKLEQVGEGRFLATLDDIAC